MKLFCHGVLALFFLALLSGQSAAQAATPWAGREEGQVRLIAGEALPQGQGFLAGLEMQLQDGWHTYWRVPGASGIAPSFDWSGSRNVAHVDVLWPSPERFEAEDDTTYGFAHHVVWPLRVTPLDRTKPVELKLAIFYGICSDICVPSQASLALPLTDADKPSPSEQLILQAAISDLPAPLPTAPTRSPRVMAWWKAGTPSLLMVEVATSANEEALLEVKTPPGLDAGLIDMNEEEGKRIFILPVTLTKGATASGAHIALAISGAHTAIHEELILP